MEQILSDIRYAIRSLRNAPGFTAVAVATLALGIGAPCAMFSVVDGLLLKPLPYREPDRLVALGNYDTRRQAQAKANGSLSYPDYLDIRSRTRTLEAVGVFHDNEFTMTGAGEATHVSGATITTTVLPILGAQPALGRSFLPEEDQPGRYVVLLSDRLWRAHFHADPHTVGRSIALNGRAYTIVGIMPDGFHFPIRSTPCDLWVTFSRGSTVDDPKETPMTAQRGNHSIEGMARLKAGVSLEQANADLESIAKALSAEYPDSNSYAGLGARPEVDRLVGGTRRAVWVLFGAVGMVLLIACANIASLLIARGTSRSREIGVRFALGASRARIVRQLITESVILSLCGAAAGAGAASWLVSAALALYPTNLPRAEAIGIDGRALAFTAALAIVTGILFGFAPAWRVSSPRLANVTRDGGRTTAGTGRSRLRSAIVIAETALGVALLIGAGLLIRSFDRLSRAPLGFDPKNVLTASFDLSETKYKADELDRFVHDLMTRLRSMPGVVNAAGSLPLPLYNDGWSVSFNLLDHPVPEANRPSAQFYVATPGFFETMRIPLVKGRFFDDRDTRNSEPVMVVTEKFANKYFPNEDPIGKRIEIGAGEGPKRVRYKTREVTGVVGGIRNSSLADAPDAAYYIPLPQLMWGPPTLVIRTAGDTRSVASAVRATLSSMDPDAPLYAVKPLEDYLALNLGRARFQATILGFFAAIALVLTAVGLYGVVSSTVQQRTKEFGIRIALGAARRDVLQMVLTRGVVLATTGIAIGVGLALALARVLESLLFDTPARDPATFLTVCGTLWVVALIASLIPGIRGSRIDPMTALRFE